MKSKTTINVKNYDYIIGYGIGQNYQKYKSYLGDIKLNYLADEKWIVTDAKEYDSIKIIRPKEIDRLINYLIIVFPSSEIIYKYVNERFNGDVCKVQDIIDVEYSITGAELKNRYFDGVYIDKFRNKVIFDDTLPDSISIFFYGCGNVIEIGHNVIANSLLICCGENSECVIENNVSIESAKFFTSFAKIYIGEDSMLAHDIIIRNHDNHHIFSLDNAERINYPKDVYVGQHVWLGHNVVLLPGTSIGNGSILGEGTITSSCFRKNVVVAGCPGKVIREKVCWSRDNTFYFNRACLGDCIDQNALKYLDNNESDYNKQ